MQQKGYARLTGLALSIITSAILAACGGGGHGGDTGSGGSNSNSASNGSTSPTSPSNTVGPATGAASSMSGTVAIGTGLVGATLTIADAAGKTSTATSGRDGAYSVSLDGLTAPFVITATDPSGASGRLYSVVANTVTVHNAPVTANVTPLTTAVAALLTADGNPMSLSQAGAASITPAAVSAAVAKLNTTLAPILAANGLSASAFDPIGGSFKPDQTGADAVIDSVSVKPSKRGAGLEITSLADPDTAIALNTNTTAGTALQNPSQPANYLATLLAQTGQCVVDTQVASTTGTACTTAIDAGYLSQGQTSFAKRHPGLFAAGSTLTGVKTVAFLPTGTLPAISNPAALVYFLFTGANGVQNFASDIVQQLPSGAWDVIGPQTQFNVYIASFLGRQQYTNSVDAGKGHYESGLNILIPMNRQTNGASVPVGSALVQGPGLPASGLYLLNTASLESGPGYLTIPSVALTAPWTGCSTCSQSNGASNAYKWDWAPMPNAVGSFTPSTADYAAKPADVSSIKQFGVYTITLYGMDGTQIGQPQKVINVAPNATAASAGTVQWQSLGSDIIDSVLTPGGSQASAGLSSLDLNWTAPDATSIYPNSWAAINVVQAATANGPEEAYSNMYFSVPTLSGLKYSETIKPLVTFEALSAERSRAVQLGWQADGEYFLNSWQYNAPIVAF